MATTYEPISTYTVTGSNLLGSTGVTFSSIPSTYTDLILVYSGKLTAAAITLLRVNGDTASNYSSTIIGGNGSGSATSTKQSGAATQWLSSYGHQNGNQGNIVVHLFNYSNTTTYKTNLFKSNNPGGLGIDEGIGLWRSTAAINSVNIYLDRAEYYLVGSMFTLYGIKAA
jgi:hypothetical protein